MIFQMHKAMFRYKSFTYSDKILLPELEGAIEALLKERKEIDSDFRFFDPSRREYLLDELKWMKEHSFNEQEQYVTCVRKGRGTVVIRRNERPAIFQTYEAFYKRLDQKGILTVELAANKILANKERIPEDLRYDFVMIDEAQDLSLIKLLVAKALAKRSMTIAADFAQKIYSTGFTWKELGLEIRAMRRRNWEKRSEIRYRSPSWQPGSRAETQRRRTRTTSRLPRCSPREKGRSPCSFIREAI